MRLLFSTIVATAAVTFSLIAHAQSPSAPATAVPAQANPAAAVPVPSGKRFACQTASKDVKGQDQRDQMQLCMAQAHLDCLKQAIDQKIVGAQRKDYVKSCMQ